MVTKEMVGRESFKILTASGNLCEEGLLLSPFKRLPLSRTLQTDQLVSMALLLLSPCQ